MRWRGCVDGHAVARLRGYAVLRFCRATAQLRNRVTEPNTVMLEILIIFGSGVAAGVVNAIAGGGTLISFPVLVWLGRDPILANATNTVAIWPGSLTGAIGFRRELATVRRWLLLLILPSCLGGALGG